MSSTTTTAAAELHALPICSTCGTQFGPTQNPTKQPLGCRICADPRQYVLSTGITYTTLSALASGTHRNSISLLSPENPNIFTLATTPKFGIGQRSFFIKTPHGNILWDLIALLDDRTTEFLRSHGGVHAIVISHPHYYTTHRHWSDVFACPVYLAPEDKEWLSFDERGGRYRWISGPTEEIVPGVTAVKVGGHFPGSLCLHLGDSMAEGGMLLVADSLVTVPSAMGPYQHPPEGVSSYAFMWSIPNMIPLTPDAIRGIVNALAPFAFGRTHGAFEGLDVRGSDVKRRVVESAAIAVRAMGWADYKL